ncbi:MAG: hypothetical protein KKA64_02790 [Nanoarchaeota archaeon]|nr:hypothetical protein [Nanoarchaeota archaeon]
MSFVKQFEDFIMGGVVKKQSPNKSRAEFLVSESKRNYYTLRESLKKIGLKEENANDFIKSCYDILMEITRAKMLLDGFNASSFGAHEAEVSYLRILGFNENEVQFVDQIRFFRNGMLYYGTRLDKEYAERVLDFLHKNYPKLLEMVKSKSL